MIAHAFDDDPPPRRLKPSGSMAGLPDGAQRRGRCEGGPPTVRTPGQRRRLRRALVIAAAHRGGLSARFLATYFGLARATVGRILDQTEGR